MRKSPFEGWTKEQQCFGPFDNGHGCYCAVGWIFKSGGDALFSEVADRIGPKLLSLFPDELTSRQWGEEGSTRANRYRVIHANDYLKLDPEIFLSLDREAIALEEAALQQQQEVEVPVG